MAQLYLIAKLQARGNLFLKSKEIDLSLAGDNIRDFLTRPVTRREGRALLHIAAEEGVLREFATAFQTVHAHCANFTWMPHLHRKNRNRAECHPNLQTRKGRLAFEGN